MVKEGPQEKASVIQTLSLILPCICILQYIFPYMLLGIELNASWDIIGQII